MSKKIEFVILGIIILLISGCVQSPKEKGQITNTTTSPATPVLTPSVSESVLTQRNNNARTGAYLAEKQLTPANVNNASFGRLYSRNVSGRVMAQPLFIKGVRINGVSRNVLYVVTLNNKIYAFDADNTDPKPDAGQVWPSRELKINNLGAAPFPGMEDGPQPCNVTRGSVGIMSTPVIDLNTNTMYLVFRTGLPPDPNFSKYTLDNPPPHPNDYKLEAHYWLDAIDIRTGLDRQPPIAITAPGFDENMQLNRAGLLLSDGVIYIAFAAAVCDSGGNPWLKPEKKPAPHGWIFAYGAQDLQRHDFFTASPQTANAGIWQSGNGLAADAQGNIYAFTGNNGFHVGSDGKADYDWIAENQSNPYGPDRTELGESILKLRLGPNGKFIRPIEYFMPGNWYRLDTGRRYPTGPTPSKMNPNGTEMMRMKDRKLEPWAVDADTDLGSGGPVLLPNGRLIGGGKQGRLYVIEPTDMRHARQGFQAFYNTWSYWIDECEYDADLAFGPNIHSDPVIWHPAGTNYALAYGMPEKEYLKAFRAYDDGQVDERPVMTTMESGIRSSDGMPGGSLSLSANGRRDGIIWVSVHKRDAMTTDGTIPGRLIALDALTLRELWRDDNDIPFVKFVPPTIANGKVFRVTDSPKNMSGGNVTYSSEIIVYGLKASSNTGVHDTPPPPEPIKRPVTAVWRPSYDHLDLFMASERGEVVSTYHGFYLGDPRFYKGDPQFATCPLQGWRGWFPINPLISQGIDVITNGSAQAITAVWRNSNHLDLFMTGADGKIWSTYWEGPPREAVWQPWFQIDPDTGGAAPGQPVTAIWRNSNHLDLFITGGDGHVWSTYFENDHWHPTWFPIDPANVIAVPGTPVTAVWRNSNHLDLFIIDIAGHVVSTYFENDHWQPAWFPIDPLTSNGVAGASVTAVWRNSNHLDLFLTDIAGHVVSTYFENDHWQPAWFPIDPLTSNGVAGAPVTAVWRNSNHLDLFLTDIAGHVVSTYFEDNHWQPAWFPVGPNSATAVPGQPVTAVWRDPTHLDLFITDKNGNVLSTFIERAGGWRDWFSI